jgi:HEPN domain-containing protein
MTKTQPTDWLFFAKSDLDGAQSLADDGIYHIACFHCQQAVEKALKAYILSTGKVPPKVHTLQELAERTAETLKEIEKFRPKLIILDTFYIPTRYPDALPGSLPDGLPTQQDAHEALFIAKELLTLVQEHI